MSHFKELLNGMRKAIDSREHGFSLFEVLVAVGILAVALPAVVHLLGVVLVEDGQLDRSIKASFLAQSIMNEISQRRFYEDALNPGNGPDGGEVNLWDRSGFDDIDDYQIFTSVWGALSPPRDEQGNSLVAYSDFSQKVEVSNVSNPGAGPTARANFTPQSEGTTDFKLVKVSITWESGKREVNLYKVFARE